MIIINKNKYQAIFKKKFPFFPFSIKWNLETEKQSNNTKMSPQLTHKPKQAKLGKTTKIMKFLK